MKYNENTIYSSQPPMIHRRGVHIDLKGLPPTFERLVSLIELIGELRFNVVMIEWEDMFPWSFDRDLRNSCSYSKEQVRFVADRCSDLGIELIPLVQSLGHMEFVLKHQRYQELSECPQGADSLHPMHKRSTSLIQQMIDDVLTVLPQTKHFHLGGDEVWSFGTHPDSLAFIDQHGKAELYLHHMNPLLGHLRDRGVRPILWHDMMMDWPMVSLRQVGRDADLMVWGYRGTPQMGTHHHRIEVLDRMREAGVPMWGAGAYKGADGPFRDLPLPEARQLNHLGWAEVAQPYELRGVVTTGWSRYATGRVQGEPIDACLRELAMASVILYNGSWPSTGWEQCDDLLKEAGELDRVETLRRHFQPADADRNEAWTIVRQINEHLAVMHTEPDQPAAGTLRYLSQALETLVVRVEARCIKVPQLLNGLVCEPYLDSYQRTWALALRHAADALAVNVDEAINRYATTPKSPAKPHAIPV